MIIETSQAFRKREGHEREQGVRGRVRITVGSLITNK